MPLKYFFTAISLLFYFLYVPLNIGNKSPSLVRRYFSFILICYPLLDLDVTNMAYGEFTVFDFVTVVTGLFSFRKICTGKRIFTFLYFIFYLLVCGLIIGALHSKYPIHALLYVFSFLPIFIFCKLLFYEIVRDKNYFDLFLKKLQFLFWLDLTFVLIQFFVDPKFSLTGLNPNVLGDDGATRYSGFFDDAQKQGCFLGMLSFILLLLNERKDTRKLSLKNGACFGLSVIMLFLAGSRGPFLGFIVGLMLLLLFLPWKVKLIFLFLCFLSGISLFYFSDSINLFNRTSHASKDVAFRERLWKGGLNIFQENKDFGIGIGNYHLYAKNIYQDQYIILGNRNEKDYLSAPESGYFTVLAEFGLYNSILVLLIVLFSVFSVFYSSGILYGNLREPKVFYFISSFLTWAFAYISFCNTIDEKILILLGIILTYLLANYFLQYCNNTNKQVFNAIPQA